MSRLTDEQLAEVAPRLIIALSATASPDPDERVLALLYVATHHATFRRPPWWRWTTWLAFGITNVRMQHALRRSKL